jgi:hypothetical protein
MSDIDKMLLQLYLDVEQFGREIANFDVDPQTLAPYQRLRQCVQEGEKFLTQAQS